MAMFSMNLEFLKEYWDNMSIIGFKTEFARAPGRGDTCHLSNLDETLPDWRDYQTTRKAKVGRLCDFSLKS